MKLSQAELAELVGATALRAQYPNWFIEKLVDLPTANALSAQKARLIGCGDAGFGRAAAWAIRALFQRRV